MAPKDARSPSPAGSHYSHSSKRAKRDDNRAPRDRRDDGYSRRENRSPPGRRDRDRTDHRDPYYRSSDRRRDDDYRSSRRERSRERYRDDGRLNSRDGDHRRRSHDRGYRERRDDSRERPRRRDDDDRDYKHKDRRDGGRGSVDGGRHNESSKPTAPRPSADEVSAEEKKKAENLAKVEAWKRKKLGGQTLKASSSPASDARAIFEAMDKKEVAPTTTSSPKSPATPATSQSPVAFAGKFDPKAIAKRAAAKLAATRSALGEDPVMPKAALGNTDTAMTGVMPTSIKAGPMKNVGAFGLGKSTQPAANIEAKSGMDFGEEENTRKTLEKLPQGSLGDVATDEAMDADGAEDNDDEEDMAGAGNEEDDAAAARAAAEKREERLLAAQAEAKAPLSNDADVSMADAPAEEEEEEEIDPLDAFMSGLTETKKAPMRKAAPKSKLKEPEAMFSDDDDELTTMDAEEDSLADIQAKATKKKEIPTVNHSKMQYEPFRKNFYTEPVEAADMTEEDLANLRFNLDGIKVRGVDVPKPVTNWAQCGLGVQTLDVVQKLGYTAPTSIQSQAIPAIMSGRDVIGIAKTGSGKTVAFLLPMFRHIKDQRPLENLDGPIGLIMTPTRELATQIHKECRPWLKALNLRAVCAYGGAPIKDQIAELKRGAEIVVCTPGRMIDLLAANSGRVTNLRRVTYAVLDEADRMFDMGFEPQVMKVLANIRPQRQLVLFSATFPRNMEALARKALSKPVEIIVGGRSVVAPEITQVVEVRPEDSKFVRLLQLLGEVHEDEDARSLVFVDRQESAEDLMAAVLRKGYPCFTIHGGKDQYDRDSVISDFKAGVFPVLVATSVAARGLDVKQLKMVVNFDCPNHLEDYVHRAGRTGRAGQKGMAVTFITEDQDKYSVDIVKALKQSGQEIPEALQKLCDNFMVKVKEGKEKASGAGFGGKGLERLDLDRDAARKRERGQFKTGDDDDEVKDDKKKDAVSLELPTVKPAGANAAASPAPAAALAGVPAGFDFDGPVKVIKTEIPAPGTKNQDRMKGVSAAVEAINARLRKTGDIRSVTALDNKGPDAGAFHSTIEINDFPQKARWAVTNRTNVAKILEATGTSITTKGNYYKPPAMPKPDELPKLYLLVEGDTEVVVQNACRELMRLLKEGILSAADGESRAPASGRYNVL